MMKDKPGSPDFSELRRQAEERVAAEPPKIDQPQGDVEKLLHELQVQQIELKLQNEELRSALEQLEESRSKYSDLYDFAPVGYLTLDEKGFILEANLTASRQIGIDRSNLINTSFSVHLSGSDGDRFRLHLHKVFRSMERQACEVGLRPKGGSELHALLESIFVQDVHGQVSCRTSIIDITGRKRVEQALRDSEKRYRELVQHANSAIIRWKSDGTLTFANEYAQAFFGYEEKEIVGKHVSVLVPETESNGLDLSTLVQDIVSHPEQYLGNINENVCRDGRRVWMAWTNKPVFDVDGKVIEILAVGTDITERKQAERALMEANATLVAAHNEAISEKNRLEAVMQALPIGVAITDMAGGTIQSNAGYEQIWGNPRPVTESVDDYAAYKARWPDTGSEVEPEEWASAVAVQRGETILNQLLEIERFDGSRAFVLNSAAPVRDAQGNVIGSAVAMRDITDLRKTEQALRESEERLRFFIEHAPASLAMFDREMRYLSASRRWLSDYNLGDCDLSGISHYEVFPEIPERWKEVHRRGLAGEIVRADADGFERVDGSVQWLCWEVRPWRDTMGDVAGIVIFTEDITERKLAERALQEAHERATWLARFPEENPNPVVRVSAEGNILYRNRPAGELPGWSCEVGMLLPDPLLPMTKEAMRDGEEARQELELGGRFYSVSVVPFPAEHYVNIYATDITERKQMEEEVCRACDDLEIRVQERTAELGKTMETLRAERQRFNDVLDVLPVYVVLLTPDYRVPFANVVFRERFGESRGLRCFEHLFGRSEPCEVCDSFKVLKTMTPHQWEWTGPDSRDYSVFDFPFTDTDGSTLILEMGIDITERKRAEEQLRQASQYSRSLIEASLDPLVTISPEGKITDINEATIRVTGVARKALIDTDFSDYFTEPEKAREVYRQVFEKGCVTDYPLTIRHQNGNLIEVLYNASLYKDERGNVRGVFAAARDITESKNVEQQLARADRLSSLGMLAGGIAHEIRNPLAGINLFIDFLNDEEKFSRTSQEQSIFEEMKLNIKKINHIIKSVLDFSRLSSTTSRSKLELSQLIHDSTQLWRSRITRDGIEVREYCGENLSEVFGDSIEIQQVLNNLIQNALEAMEKGGTLTISVENGILSFDRKRPAVIIRVQDSGPGIPFDRQKIIFNPFFTTKSTGTGLGLAISHRIVVSHGGGISFESVPDVGTTFIVELPAAPRG